LSKTSITQKAQPAKVFPFTNIHTDSNNYKTTTGQPNSSENKLQERDKNRKYKTKTFNHKYNYSFKQKAAKYQPERS